MNKIGRACIVLVVAHLVGIASSCCDEPVTLCYTLTSLETNSLDNTGAAPVPLQSDTLPAKAYVLEISFFVDDATCLLDNLGNFSFYSSALAFDCDDNPRLILRDSIISLEITSTADFDAEHPKGTDLSGLFVKPSTATIAGQIMPFSITDPASMPSTFRLYLVGEPETIQPHRFITTILTDTGLMLSDTTETITLTL